MDLIEKYDISESEATNLDVKKWAKEAFDYSKSTVYPTIEKNVMPADEYVEKARSVAERQVVLGGHRLANLLKSLNLKAHEKPLGYFDMIKQEFIKFVDYIMAKN